MIMYIALIFTAVLWAITKSPGAMCKRHAFAFMNIFHSRETPKKTTRWTEGGHVCNYVIDATRNCHFIRHMLVGFVVFLYYSVNVFKWGYSLNFLVIYFVRTYTRLFWKIRFNNKNSIKLFNRTEKKYTNEQIIKSIERNYQNEVRPFLFLRYLEIHFCVGTFWSNCNFIKTKSNEETAV